MTMNATPTTSGLRLRQGDFASLSEALDYAADGETGYNFYDRKGALRAVLGYAALREDAEDLGRRLASLELPRGAHVALMADADPDFMRLFFACQRAGLVPVTLPVSPHLSSHQAYVAQLRRLLQHSRADVAMAPAEFLPFMEEAARAVSLRFLGTPAELRALPRQEADLRPLARDEVAYIQFTSGTTRAGRGVVVTQAALMANLHGILRHGLDVTVDDRAASWLPSYHDMGFVGFVLAPMASQVSVDFLSPADFVKRPLLWLDLITQRRGTISFSPSFGYELCARRLRPEDVVDLDLSSWRVAGVGAEMIRADFLERFVKALAPAGFDRHAFLACYGMAECALAVSMAPLGKGLDVDRIDRQQLAEAGTALPVDDLPAGDVSSAVTFAKCGTSLPGYEIEIRDESGRAVIERSVGVIFVRGASVMSGYFADPEATREVLSPDGWLDTGDIGYRADGNIVITGRKKDLLIINGRNIWPQEIELVAEEEPEVRTAAAFSSAGLLGEETAVLLVECRQADRERRTALVRRIRGAILAELGIHCTIELVAPHTLPRTSSGKLSRPNARAWFVEHRGHASETPWQT
jgi:fatty-acyl-CoA synthase